MGKYVFKAKIKKLIIDDDGANKVKKSVEFKYSETIKVADRTFIRAYTCSENDDQVQAEYKEKLVESKSFECDDIIFDFLSQHSKEELTVTIDENSEKLIKVELSYE